MASQHPAEAQFHRIPGAEALRDPQSGRYTPEYLACAACGALVPGGAEFTQRHLEWHESLPKPKVSLVSKPESKGTRVGEEKD